MPFVHAGSLSLDSLVAGLALVPLLPRAPERVAASVLALLGLAVGARLAGGLRSGARIGWVAAGLLATTYLAMAV